MSLARLEIVTIVIEMVIMFLGRDLEKNKVLKNKQFFTNFASRFFPLDERPHSATSRNLGGDASGTQRRGRPANTIDFLSQRASNFGLDQSGSANSLGNGHRFNLMT